ncbi:F-box/LRR-repeat protein 4 [Paragonimus heterotremus]|uniref:F-box/LRR-repeat protein 4 n=1 Tax=Paragonimus heterotremus TaxID=100268 RepID=A0A8J4WRK4_9TREM|nr:F-box/LRR-repeat protein 4 [Paragonimus heterotremus]
MFCGRNPGFELVHQYAFEVVDFSSQYGPENDTNYTAGNLVGACQVYPNYCDSSATCSFRHFGHWSQLCSSALKPISSPPDGYTSADYVDLFFDVPVVPTRIQVFETYNPGAIVRILACYRSQPPHEPVNARKLHWVTLWTAPRSRSSNIVGVQTPRQLQLQYTSSESDPDNSRALALTTLSLRHRSPNFSSDEPSYIEFTEHLYSSHFQQHLGCAHIFQPPLTNVPPFPTDLIRIELDSGRCGYYPELDAVRLTGWAEVSRWSGFTQLEDTVTRDSSQTIHSSPRVGPHASFFSELLRPRTPHLCIPSDGCPPNTESMDASVSALSPISSPDASPNCPPMLPVSNPFYTRQLLSGALIQPSMYSDAASTIHDDSGSSSLCRLPPVGLDMLLPRVGHIVAVSPGLICPVSLFGLMHLDENAPWRQGPLTRLPVS